jgi:hypothetical protein
MQQVVRSPPCGWNSLVAVLAKLPRLIFCHQSNFLQPMIPQFKNRLAHDSSHRETLFPMA